MKRKKRISCAGKIKHKSITGACIATRKLFKLKNLVAYPYKCRRCGFWHIGKPTYCDDPILFWNNVFNQMSDYDLKKLKEGI
jgi:hypothetical protein